jgi:hypothetical protein
MSFAELLDAAFRIVRDHFGLLVGITSAVYIPFAVMSAIAMPANGQFVLGPLVSMLVLALVVLPIGSVALTYAVGEIYLGRQTSILRSFRVALRLIVPLMGTMMLVYLGVIVGLLLLVIPGLYLSLTWILASPIVVLEGVYGTRALGRSRMLMQGNKWRGIGILLLGWIIVTVLDTVLGYVFGLIPMLGPVGQGLAQAIGVAYSTVVLVLLYFDVRCRKEAFDLEHLAQLVESPAPEAA